MITQKEIAESLGLSTATVSYVLNNKSKEKNISKETQNKILKFAYENGYNLLNELSIRKSIYVYWVNQGLELTTPSIIRGIHSFLTNNNSFDISLRVFDKGSLSDESFLRKDDKNSAAVIIGANKIDLDYLDSHKTKVPVILVNRDLKDYSSVSINHNEAGKIAVNYASKKSKSISIILSDNALYGLNVRGDTMIEYCQKKNIDISDKIYYSLDSIDAGYELGLKLSNSLNEPCTFICVNDTVALGMMSAFTELGVEVGNEIKILATSNGMKQIFSRSIPPMTVIDLKMSQITNHALSLAADSIDKEVYTIEKKIINPELIIRKSC